MTSRFRVGKHHKVSLDRGSAKALVLTFSLSVALLGQVSLKTVPVPRPSNLDHYVRDSQSLLVLGKALFWDTQVGSDSQTACGTCHFHAGADHRAQNQLSNPNGAFTANHRLLLDEYPFRKFANSSDNRSDVLRDSGQRTGSAGVFRRAFSALTASGSEEAVEMFDAPSFRVGDFNIRQVTPRNTPTVINAVFNVRNFRDGRASDIFTGRTPFGDSDTRMNAVAVVNGSPVPEFVRMVQSSLASLAVGPPMNTTEMSYEGRTWPVLAQKLLASTPLARQSVAPDDSVLGPFANAAGRGLSPALTYLALVQTAFRPEYWDSTQLVDEIGRAGTPKPSLTIAQYNFPFFFGLAIQSYLSTLVSDDSRFDQFAEGKRNVLTPQEQNGFFLFQGGGFCTFCHGGPEFTGASFTFTAVHGSVDSVLSGPINSVATFFSDSGFFNTGVRPGSEDPGLEGRDDFDMPFSIAERRSIKPLAIRGAFKTPGLRNIEFTGPYFHNGGQATLEQVVEFYSRGGDLPDSPGTPVEITPLNLTPQDIADLSAFLKTLSDNRVRFERAPFDHPEICVPVGYPDQPAFDPAFPTSAADRWTRIPPVGKLGNSVPLQTFDELLRGVGSDGTRAHTLLEPCSVH